MESDGISFTERPESGKGLKCRWAGRQKVAQMVPCEGIYRGASIPRACSRHNPADPSVLPPHFFPLPPLQLPSTLGFSGICSLDGRTESGGLSFDAIHRIMALCPAVNDGSVLVVPDSSKGARTGQSVSRGEGIRGDFGGSSPDF